MSMSSGEARGDAWGCWLMIEVTSVSVAYPGMAKGARAACGFNSDPTAAPASDAASGETSGIGSREVYV